MCVICVVCVFNVCSKIWLYGYHLQPQLILFHNIFLNELGNVEFKKYMKSLSFIYQKPRWETVRVLLGTPKLYWLIGRIWTNVDQQ